MMEPNLKWLRSPKEWFLIQFGMGIGAGRTREASQMRGQINSVLQTYTGHVYQKRMVCANRSWGAHLVHCGRGLSKGGTNDSGEGRPWRTLHSMLRTLDFTPKVIGNN